MTQERDIERILDRWLADGPDEVPDRVFDAVVDRIERQSQRPAWRLPRRDTPMTYLKPVIATAAVIVVAIVGYSLLPLGVSGPGASPSPSRSPSPIPSVSASPRPISLTSQGWAALPASRYIHDQSTPAVTMEIPDGWWLTVEVPWGFGIRPEAYTVDEGLRAWYDMRVTMNDAECTEAPDPAIGHTADDLIGAWSARPGIVATAPQPISVGGLEGSWIDIHLAPDWTGTCPFDTTQPGVTLFTDADPASGNGTPFWGISGDEHLRIIALDDTAGSTVLIVLDTLTGETFAALVAESMPVVDTFEFEVAP